MTSDLLAEIARRGLALEADGANLRLLGPRERMDADLVAQIRAGKFELLQALATREATSRGGDATGLQRSYLLGRQGVAGLGDVASHVYHEFVGHWDLARLQAALNQVVARHDSLRTRFTASGGRVVEPAAAVSIEVTDLSHLGEREQELALQRLRNYRSHRKLPVDRAPLIAVEASLLDERQTLLHVSHDGLAMDGISMFLFFDEWQRRYLGTCSSDEPAVPPFDVYVEALQRIRDSAPALRSRSYWLERIEQLPSHPELPLARDPSSITEPTFVQREIRLDPGRWSALNDQASAAGVTPTVALLSAYAETLAFWGADRQMTINTTMANRPPIHPGVNRAIGQYSDVLLVAVDVDPDVDFRQRTQGLQARLRRDLDNRHFSGLSLMRALQHRGAGAARMPYTFNSTLGYPEPAGSGSALSAFGREVFCVSQTPQVWMNVFVMEQDDELVVQVDTVDDLFPPGLPEAFVAGYQRMLERLPDRDTWTARTVDLLPDDQRRRRRLVNATESARPRERAHDRFLHWARQQPDAPAVITTGRTMSYGELAQRAAVAANWLRAQGVTRDELVGLVMHRGPEQIVAVLAVAMAGAAYLPVDADLPELRRDYLLRDGRVRCILTNVPQPRSTAGIAVHPIDLGSVASGPETPTQPASVWSPDDLLYVLYTSGTTGEPKGVMVSHRSVSNVVADCNERFSVKPSDRFFGISAFNFDLSVYDIFGSLSAGAAVVLPDHDRATDPAHWLSLCRQHGVTIWNSVPAIVAMLQDQAIVDDAQDLARLRLIMMSGDRIPPALPASLRRLLPDATLISLGGPTETTVWNILHPIVPSDLERDSIPYGRPNANNRCYLLDEHGRERPDWVSGEICGAGTGLARGYWGDESRTAARFLNHAALGERIYRTGDLGRYLPNGDVAILGRTDFQIKVNGYRIEAGEVETRLAQVTGIKQAAVVAQESALGSRLVAHLAAAGAPRPSDTEIRTQLRLSLPEYMVPAVFEWHDALPLTGNGKINRSELTRLGAAGPHLTRDGVAESAEPQPDGPIGPVEEALFGIWSAILKADVPDASTSFYDLGGDSLAAARVLTRIRERFGTAVALDQFYLVDTVRAMAALIAQSTGVEPDRALVQP